MSNARTVSPTAASGHLDALQLSRLESSFRDWAVREQRADVLSSRKRILLIFLLIRYTGAKLHEVLMVRPHSDINVKEKTITFGAHGENGAHARQVHVSDALLADFFALSRDVKPDDAGYAFAVDPAFVRRKFYERAQACGFTKRQGGPEMLRKARALELVRENLPLPAVRRMLGSSTLDVASAQALFSENELRQVTRWFLERESGRMTSARNSLFGKITALTKGDIQSLLEMTALDGKPVKTIVTNDSVSTMGLRVGRMITAEIKAPWLIVERADRPGSSSADNEREGSLVRITRGGISTECIVRIGQNLELCAVVSTAAFDALSLGLGDRARVLFSCHCVVLHTEHTNAE
jgi:molybdate transport system regulatory protein